MIHKIVDVENGGTLRSGRGHRCPKIPAGYAMVTPHSQAWEDCGSAQVHQVYVRRV